MPATHASNRAISHLTGFGLVAIGLMTLTHALEARSAWVTLAFAGSRAFGSAYGFLQGAWPFRLVAGVRSLVAPRKRRMLPAST